MHGEEVLNAPALPSNLSHLSLNDSRAMKHLRGMCCCHGGCIVKIKVAKMEVMVVMKVRVVTLVVVVVEMVVVVVVVVMEVMIGGSVDVLEVM